MSIRKSLQVETASHHIDIAATSSMVCRKQRTWKERLGMQVGERELEQNSREKNVSIFGGIYPSLLFVLSNKPNRKCSM